MKTKLHLFFFAVLCSVGMHAQSITVTSTLPATIETGDSLDFTADYDTNGVTPYTMILYYYESDNTTRSGGQDVVNINDLVGTATVSMNAPLVAGNYYARVFIENPSDYSKTETARIPFTVIAKTIPVKATYLFDTDSDTEGWTVATTGGGGSPVFTVASGVATLNRGTTTWGTTYIEQNTYKLDPTIHTYVHITYKKTAWGLNNEIVLDWITSGATRSSANGALVTISTNGMDDFETVTYDLGANAEWTGADATYFRLYVREHKETNDGSTKSGDVLIDSIVFDNNATIGVDEVETNLEDLTIAPNPFTDSFTYKFAADIEEPVTIELFTIDGRKVSTIQSDASFSNEGTVNTTDLSSGMYLVRFSSGDVQEIRRLIKN